MAGSQATRRPARPPLRIHVIYVLVGGPLLFGFAFAVLVGLYPRVLRLLPDLLHSTRGLWLLGLGAMCFFFAEALSLDYRAPQPLLSHLLELLALAAGAAVFADITGMFIAPYLRTSYVVVGARDLPSVLTVNRLVLFLCFTSLGMSLAACSGWYSTRASQISYAPSLQPDLQPEDRTPRDGAMAHPSHRWLVRRKGTFVLVSLCLSLTALVLLVALPPDNLRTAWSFLLSLLGFAGALAPILEEGRENQLRTLAAGRADDDISDS